MNNLQIFVYSGGPSEKRSMPWPRHCPREVGMQTERSKP